MVVPQQGALAFGVLWQRMLHDLTPALSISDHDGDQP
jgi:hypothetical protein